MAAEGGRTVLTVSDADPDAGACHVLVTRPAQGAAETARQLRALGFAPVATPLLTIVPRAVVSTGPVAAIALTSGNAVPAIPPALRDLPLFAVGDATAEAARAVGCTDVRSAAGDAVDLARLLLGGTGGPVLLLAGVGQGFPVARALRAGGLRVQRRVAYAARAHGVLTPDALKLLADGRVHGIVFMSAATAARFVTVLPADAVAALRPVVAACIGAHAGAVLGHLPWGHLRVSLKPTLQDTLALL